MKKSLLFIAVTVAAMQSHGQYTFSTFTEAYQPLENSTEIIENDYDEGIWDDPEFQIDLEFTFPVLDEEYTSLIQDGVGATLALTNGNSSNYFMYGSDLIDGELETDFSPSTISYVTEGEIGSRILKIQYENCGFYNIIDGLLGGEVTNRVNFQMWFYETGIFEMRFGSNSITDFESAHEGLGPIVLLAAMANEFTFEAEYLVLLTGDPANPTLDFDINTKEEPQGMSADPSDGRVYQFAPNPLSVNEISIKDLKLYPTQAEQTIFIDGLETPNTIYRIVDITGKVQMSGMVNQKEGIDISKLNNGLYLFQAEGYSSALKFVKLK